MRFTIDLDGDEKALTQLLRRLLKILGRAYGVRCRRIEATRTDD